MRRLCSARAGFLISEPHPCRFSVCRYRCRTSPLTHALQVHAPVCETTACRSYGQKQKYQQQRHDKTTCQCLAAKSKRHLYLPQWHAKTTHTIPSTLHSINHAASPHTHNAEPNPYTTRRGQNKCALGAQLTSLNQHRAQTPRTTTPYSRVALAAAALKCDHLPMRAGITAQTINATTLNASSPQNLRTHARFQNSHGAFTKA